MANGNLPKPRRQAPKLSDGYDLKIDFRKITWLVISHIFYVGMTNQHAGTLVILSSPEIKLGPFKHSTDTSQQGLTSQ